MQNFEYYMTVEVLEPNWHTMDANLQAASTVDEVRTVTQLQYRVPMMSWGQSHDAGSVRPQCHDAVGTEDPLLGSVKAPYGLCRGIHTWSHTVEGLSLLREERASM